MGDDATDITDVPDISYYEVPLQMKKDRFCRDMAEEVGRAETQFRINDGNILCKRASFNNVP